MSARALYSAWRAFYAEKVSSWMSLEELRAECGKLQTADATSPEVLLIHAMHLLERYEPRMKTLGAQKGVVAWARQVYARPVNAPEPAGEWDELVDIEFHNRPEKPEGEGWRPLVLADTGDGAAPLMMEEREQRDEALLRQVLEALEALKAENEMLREALKDAEVKQGEVK